MTDTIDNSGNPFENDDDIDMSGNPFENDTNDDNDTINTDDQPKIDNNQTPIPTFVNKKNEKTLKKRSTKRLSKKLAKKNADDEAENKHNSSIATNHKLKSSRSRSKSMLNLLRVRKGGREKKDIITDNDSDKSIKKGNGKKNGKKTSSSNNNIIIDHSKSNNPGDHIIGRWSANDDTTSSSSLSSMGTTKSAPSPLVSITGRNMGNKLQKPNAHLEKLREKPCLTSKKSRNIISPYDKTQNMSRRAFSPSRHGNSFDSNNKIWVSDLFKKNKSPSPSPTNQQRNTTKVGAHNINQIPEANINAMNDAVDMAQRAAIRSHNAANELSYAHSKYTEAKTGDRVYPKLSKNTLISTSKKNKIDNDEKNSSREWGLKEDGRKLTKEEETKYIMEQNVANITNEMNSILVDISRNNATSTSSNNTVNSKKISTSLDVISELVNLPGTSSLVSNDKDDGAFKSVSGKIQNEHLNNIFDSSSDDDDLNNVENNCETMISQSSEEEKDEYKEVNTDNTMDNNASLNMMANLQKQQNAIDNDSSSGDDVDNIKRSKQEYENNTLMMQIAKSMIVLVEKQETMEHHLNQLKANSDTTNHSKKQVERDMKKIYNQLERIAKTQNNYSQNDKITHIKNKERQKQLQTVQLVHIEECIKSHYNGPLNILFKSILSVLHDLNGTLEETTSNYNTHHSLEIQALKQALTHQATTSEYAIHAKDQEILSLKEKIEEMEKSKQTQQQTLHRTISQLQKKSRANEKQASNERAKHRHTFNQLSSLTKFVQKGQKTMTDYNAPSMCSFPFFGGNDDNDGNHNTHVSGEGKG